MSEIGDQDVRRGLRHLRERLRPVLGEDDLEAFVPQERREPAAGAGLVVGHEDAHLRPRAA
jgi:hypothetical protein